MYLLEIAPADSPLNSSPFSPETSLMRGGDRFCGTAMKGDSLQ